MLRDAFGVPDVPEGAGIVEQPGRPAKSQKQPESRENTVWGCQKRPMANGETWLPVLMVVSIVAEMRVYASPKRR
jgi:hypothetical protein